MSEIGALEARITDALDRIRKGLDARAAAAASDDSVQADLEKEREANAELVERVAILKDRQDTQVASLTTRVETQRGQLQKLDAELRQLRASNAQLREMNTQLRGEVSPALHDAAVAAEMTALHALRSADAAEVDAIITELKPLIAET